MSRRTRKQWLSQVMPLPKLGSGTAKLKRQKKKPKAERAWLVALPGCSPISVLAQTAGEARARVKVMLGRPLPVGTKTEALEGPAT